MRMGFKIQTETACGGHFRYFFLLMGGGAFSAMWEPFLLPFSPYSVPFVFMGAFFGLYGGPFLGLLPRYQNFCGRP